MTTFYALSSMVIVVLLVIATSLFISERKKAGDWWLAAFFGSLVLNTIWAFVGPILAGMESTRDQFDIGNLISRFISLAGYASLLVFAIGRKRASTLSAESNPRE